MACSFPCYLLPATKTTNATAADGHQMVSLNVLLLGSRGADGHSFAAPRRQVAGLDPAGKGNPPVAVTERAGRTDAEAGDGAPSRRPLPPDASDTIRHRTPSHVHGPRTGPSDADKYLTSRRRSLLS
jgi:hypothetical protein